MLFKEVLSQEISDRVLDDELFLQEVSKYSTLEEALSILDDEYVGYYSTNEKSLTLSLKKLDLIESVEQPGYLGFARPDEKVIKKIKYKGEILLIEYDTDNQVWVPSVAKRSIVQAIRYAKFLVDDQVKKRDS